MARAGFQIEIVGSRASASLPCLSSGSGSGSGAGVSSRRTDLHLPLSRADCSLRRRRFRLHQSSSDLQFGIFLRKVSKWKVDLGAIGCSVAPRSRLEEVSTAKEAGERTSSKVFNDEAISGREDDGDVSRFSGKETSSSATAADEENGSFNWLAQWYPVAVLKHLDKKQPHPVTILGRDLVMWWDRTGAQWQVFADACPHRLAPLSEGRINEQGHLQCSYHGWSFAPNSGACTLIPQATEDVFEKRNSKRSCAVVYPSTEQQGLLWVFMDTSVGREELAGISPPLMPVLSDPEFVYDLGMSDLSYSYETLIENLLDPAHVPFAHHGIQGRRESARPLDFQITSRIESTGFRGNRGDSQLHDFIAPCLSTMDFILPPPKPPKGHPWALKLRELIMSKGSGEGSKMQISTVFLCVPMLPEKSRVFFAFPRNFAKVVYKVTPKWWNHLVHMTVLDSDMMLLHLLERRLQDRGGMSKIEKLFYCPTASDAFVIAYRIWLKRHGGSVPDFGPKATDKLPPITPRKAIFDRHSLHVKYCTYCSGAERNLKLLESVLCAMPFVLIGLVAASNSRPLRGVNAFSIPLLCTGFFCFLASRWLQAWIKKHYEYHDYNHALVK